VYKQGENEESVDNEVFKREDIRKIGDSNIIEEYEGERGSKNKRRWELSERRRKQSRKQKYSRRNGQMENESKF
jgi:hypothetical protein